MLNISTRESEWDAVIATAEREPDVWAAIGIHPNEADHYPDIGHATLIARAAHPRVVAIGETGLDYFYERSDRIRQQASFRTHIAACRDTGLPLIVHTRDAEADTLAILRDEMEQGAYTGVIHCFTASGAFADAALALGLYISISGIVTFKNARDLQETAARLPIDRLLIETDAPFLARCQPRQAVSRRSSPIPPPSSPRCAESRSICWRRGRRTISSRCSARRADEGPHPRLRYVIGRAADRQ